MSQIRFNHRRRTVEPRSPLAQFITALIGGVFLIAMGLLVRTTGAASADDIVVEGTVVEVDTSRRDGSTQYKPTVEFVDPDTGLTHVVTASWSSSTRRQVGDPMEVAFPPGRPFEAKVLSTSLVWISWGLFALGGVVLVGGLRRAIRRLAGAGSGVSQDVGTPTLTAADSANPPTGTPGWFADPSDAPGELRWWDGHRWTDHRTADPTAQVG